MVDELPSPGWQAIDDALSRLYFDQTPRHVGYIPPAAVSSNLQGCSAFRASDHWHYVTYGLSELYVPDPTNDPAISGWGFELSFRLRLGLEPEAPGWPFTILNRLANYQNEGALMVAPAGTRINLGGPITGFPHTPDGPDTKLGTLAVAVDPQLGQIQTENGRVTFLLLVGVTDEERGEMVATSTGAILERLAVENPLLITDVRAVA